MLGKISFAIGVITVSSSLWAGGASVKPLDIFVMEQLGKLKSNTQPCVLNSAPIRQGKTQLDLALYSQGDDNQRLGPSQVGYQFYRQGECKQLLIDVPQQYAYWESSQHRWIGPLVCTDNGISSSSELHRVLRHGKPMSNIYLLKETSCGSLGCSYLITVGHIDPKSLDFCHTQ